MGGIGTTEILVVAVVALVLFGPGKIPEFARQLGRTVNMFKNGLRESMHDETTAKDERGVPGKK